MNILFSLLVAFFFSSVLNPLESDKNVVEKNDHMLRACDHINQNEISKTKLLNIHLKSSQASLFIKEQFQDEDNKDRLEIHHIINLSNHHQKMNSFNTFKMKL